MASRKFRLLLTSRKQQPSPIWLTIYSDLMTNLMLFFLMLWGLTRIESQNQQNMLQGMEDTFRGNEAVVRTRMRQVLDKLKEEDAAANVESMIKKKKLEEYAKIEVTEQEMTVPILKVTLFDLGDRNLKNEAIPALDEVAALLKNMPNEVIVEGHTDNLPVSGGTYQSNWELSIARALSVIEYFVSKGLSPERFIAAGYGEYHPIYPNDTPENRALNRRIEINIIRRRNT